MAEPLVDGTLPHPVLPQVAYGAPLVPSLWNDLAAQIQANFAALRSGTTRVVPYVADLAELTDVSDGNPFALVLGEFSLWLFLDGDSDQQASELEFFGRLRRVGVGIGAWYEVVPRRQLEFWTSDETTYAGPGGTTDLLANSPRYVFTDGAAPLVIDVNVTGVSGTGATLFVEVTVDGSVVDYLQFQGSTGPASHLRTVVVPPAGQHAVSARMRSIGGTTNSVVTRFTLTASAA